MELTEKLKREIEAMPMHELIRRIRFSPIDDPYFQGEVGEFFMKVSDEKRKTDPAGHVLASKAVGW